MHRFRRGSLFKDNAAARSGLVLHPTYLSARVTLGRALLALDRLEEAESELASVLDGAPENLSALKALGEICHRRGRLQDALAHFDAALNIARNDPDLQEAVARLSRQLGPTTVTASSNGSDWMSLSARGEPFAPLRQNLGCHRIRVSRIMGS